MNAPSTVDRLAALPALAEIPRDQLEWLVRHGTEHHFEDGQVIHGGVDDADGPLPLLVVISGRFSVRVQQGGVEREVREVNAGGITGFLPYSRMAKPRGFLVADGPVDFLEIEQEDLPAMTRACYEFTRMGVHEMLDRVRVFKGEDKTQEKMAALGRLSAGLAHELNNPASAAARAAAQLDTARSELVAAARALGGAGLDGEGERAVEELVALLDQGGGALSSGLARAGEEDALVDWLEGIGCTAELAYALAERGIGVSRLAEAAEVLSEAQLVVAVRYLAADAGLRDLTASISSAAERVHGLVAAVKKHTHMDRAPVRERVELAQHLTDAVSLMSAKAREKGVVVELRADPESVAVDGSVADLNQVWMHLVDNAIDAAPDGGRVSLEVEASGAAAVVRVVDDGPGVPEDDRERIFEPFFTTKDVGEGRGLGLDIVRTVVRGHRGAVEVFCTPGRTEFRVTLPVSST